MLSHVLHLPSIVDLSGWEPKGKWARHFTNKEAVPKWVPPRRAILSLAQEEGLEYAALCLEVAGSDHECQADRGQVNNINE